MHYITSYNYITTWTLVGDHIFHTRITNTRGTIILYYSFASNLVNPHKINEFQSEMCLPKQNHHHSREEYHSPLVGGTEQAMLVEVRCNGRFHLITTLHHKCAPTSSTVWHMWTIRYAVHSSICYACILTQTHIQAQIYNSHAAMHLLTQGTQSDINFTC